MIDRNNFITIQGWMVSDLHLSGSELICYALIYGFSQDDNSVFCGSANYIANWLGVDRRQVMRILQRLVDKKLITKIEKTVNNVLLVDYKAIVPSAAQNVIPCDKMSHPCDKMSHHNIVDIDKEKKDIIIINNNNTERKEKTKIDPELENTIETILGLLRVGVWQAIGREPNTSDWKKHIRLMITADKIPIDEIYDVMDWHFNNLGREYCHEIQSARSFREKFNSLTIAKKRMENDIKPIY